MTNSRVDQKVAPTLRSETCPSDVDFSKLKGDFPVLGRTVHGHRVVYLDSAASAQRPQSVLDAMDTYYQTTHANVHRGVYTFAEEADRLYEAARVAVGRLIGAPDPEHEVIFTKNATEAINLVAATWARSNLGRGDVVLLTDMEHHANIVPWLMLAEERGIELRWIGIDDDYRLDLSDLDRLLDGVKLVACTTMSNVLGTITPFAQIAEAAHRAGARGARRRCPVGSPCPHRRAPAWAVTSWPSAPTRCSAPPASACCGDGANCSRRCHRSWVGAG